MVTAVIFAGGVGTRMQSGSTPKQFLTLNDKPILIYTLEKFQNNPNVDAIVLACVESHIEVCRQLVEKFGITKLKPSSVVVGGATGQESIYHGLKAAAALSQSDDDIVLIHDGVRPLIDDDIINRNIDCVVKNRNAITSVECKETVVLVDDCDKIDTVVDRSRARLARAPQSFYLKDILSVHEKAIKDGMTTAIDSATLMRTYGHDLHVVIGKSENIKITTPDDYYVFKAILESKSNSAVFGY